jgi:RNA polymerase sigma-70 factor, ECF subfamily
MIPELRSMRTDKAVLEADDASLVRETRGGSTAALGRLYERHAPVVITVALRLLGSRADAEDVLQDVFVGLPDALAAYEERGAFAAWLRRVTVRTALMSLRRRSRTSHVPLAGSDPFAAPEREPERGIAARRAIDALPDALRVVFVLREVEGYSHAEISELLGITRTASALRHHRAWKLIRRSV